MPASPSPTPQPPPNLTGTWKGTLTEVIGDRRTFDLTATLMQGPGSTTVSGTLVTTYRDAQFLETITAGSHDQLSVELETVIYDAYLKPFYYRYHGLVDATGASMHGTSEVVGGAACCTWEVRR